MGEVDLAWSCRVCEAALEETSPVELSCPRCGRTIAEDGGVWLAEPGLCPAGFPPERRAHLEQLTEGHFWFPPRWRLLSRLLGRFCRGRGLAVDLGCGTGAFLRTLAERFETVVGVDAYAESLRRARRRLGTAVLVQGEVARVPLASGQAELAVALDVLEHSEPMALLVEARRLVKPQGWLMVSVPAFPSLWSELDAAAGHRTRYRLPQLRLELRRAGWRTVHWTHYQALLFPLVFLVRRAPFPRFRSLERRPPAALSRCLGWVNALEVALFGGLRLPFGSSLVALARRA